MKGLVITHVPPEYDPIERQRDLQKMIAEHRPGKTVQTGAAESIGELLHRIRFNHEADAAEKIEMLDWLPWKEWKTYEGVTLYDPPSDELRHELLFECADRLHFLLNEVIALGFSWQDFIGAFEAKQRENRRRQRDGY